MSTDLRDSSPAVTAAMALEDGLKTMTKTFRRECHSVAHSARATVHGADSMLMVLRLAMAEVNKQRTGESHVALSDVLLAWKRLLLDKLHLPLRHSPCLEDYDRVLQMYQSFLSSSNTVDLVDVYTASRRPRADAEEIVTPVQLFEFLSGHTEASEVTSPLGPSTPSGERGPDSVQIKMEVRRVFVSYLDLLVNGKNDLALARVLDVPGRALGRTAFTDLKHAARNANTSLFMAATSFVRAIQLGGKGYAPADSDPLRKHVKGLSDFVQFIDNLEETLGDIPDPSACGAKLVSTIRAALVKGHSSGDAVYAAAGETAKHLKERISQLHQSQKCSASGTGISPARPRAHVINHATAYGGRETVKVLTALLDEEALAPPCRNKADLLSEDQPVLGGEEGSCVLTLFRSPEVATGGSPEPLKNRVQSRQDLLKPKVRDRVIRSQFACTYGDGDVLPLNRVLDFPSSSQLPTCVHPAPKRILPDPAEGNATESHMTERIGSQRGAALEPRCGNAQKGEASRSSGKMGAPPRGKASKRKQADDCSHGGSENQPPPKKSTAGVPGKMAVRNIPKAPSKKKLIAGQGKLTSFFRV